jgi:hypothetical protein
MSNIVIMVWMKHLNAGFGDMLRGTIYLYKLSQQLKFKLIVDTQLHPVSNFLISQPHEYSDYVIQNKSKIIHTINAQQADSIVNQIRDHGLSCNPNPILITTNYSDNHGPPSAECKQFMRSMLIPNDEFKTYFNDMCVAFKIPKHYSIMHFRVGDDDLMSHKSVRENYHKLINIVNENIATTPNLHIIADSAMFKQYLKTKLHPKIINRVIPTNPIHLSHPNANVETIKETLFDFMLLTNARIIKTHSTYGWISGFVQWVSHIFNVPLINLKPKIQPMNFANLNPPPQLMRQPMKSQPMKLMMPMKSAQPMSSLMTQIRTNFSTNPQSMKLRF